jgi:hypothetical protein
MYFHERQSKNAGAQQQQQSLLRACQGLGGNNFIFKYIFRDISPAGRRHVDFHFRSAGEKKGKKSDGRKFRRSGGGEKMKTSFGRTRPF